MSENTQNEDKKEEAQNDEGEVSKDARFFGERKVMGIEDIERKTPHGNDMIRVIYADNSSKEMPKRVFENIVSEEPIDANEVREKRLKPLLSELSSVVMEHDLPYDDIKAVAQRLANRLMYVYDRATNILWTEDDDKFIPGVDPVTQLTILDAEKKYKEKRKELNEQQGE